MLFRQVQEATLLPVRELDGGSPDFDRKFARKLEVEVQGAGGLPR